ncbi:MAG TPA: M56 family metallopeptidase [Phycisphaerae bacterium]|nr:M56 family metallopeptidase [Phycisphaerae bacterium]
MMIATTWENLSLTLVHSLWQGAGLTVLLWAGLKLLPATRPNVRYVAAMAALVGVMVSGMATWHVLLREEAVRTGPVVAGSDAAPDHGAAVPAAGGGQIDPPAPSESIASAPVGVTFRWHGWVAALWLAGVAAMLVRSALSVRGAARLSRQAGPLPDPGIRGLVDELAAAMRVARPVRIGVCRALHSPAVVGAVWPTILVPPAMLAGMSAEQLRAVLAHELAHVRRYDYLAGLVQMLIEAAGFFNPAVWWISRQVRIEREACCDAAAVAAGGGPVPIAQAIAAWAQQAGGTLAPAPAALARGRAGSLPERLRRIIHPDRRPTVRLCWYSLAAMLLAGAVVLAGLDRGTALAVEAAAALLSPQERMEQVERAGKTHGPITEGSAGAVQVIVSGVLRTHDGRPLDGKRAYLNFRSVRQGSSLTKGVSPGGTYFMADGRFRVPVEFGEIRVQAWSPGYALASAGPFMPADGKVDGVELVLTAGFTGRLRLVDPDGKGIGGASPSLWYASGTTAIPYDGEAKPVTDADGLLSVPHLADQPLRMDLRHDGFQYEQCPVNLTPEAVTTIQLRRARPVTGKVISAVTGAAVAGASVKLLCREGFAAAMYHPDEENAPVLATSDAQGRFVVTTLRDDCQYELFVWAAEHGCVFLRSVRAGQKGLEVKLGPELYVRGRVKGPLDKLLRHQRRPSVICRTNVRLGAEGNSSYGSFLYAPVTIRDGEGSFEFRGRWPGPLRIDAGGKTIQLDLTEPVEDLVIDLSEPSPAARAKRAVVIRLDVPAGAPAPTGTVRVAFTPEPARQAVGDHLHELLPIDKGQVRVEVAAPGRLGCTPEGTVGYWFKEVGTTIAAGDGPVTVNVPCTPAGAIYGQVLEADGSPANLTGPNNAMVSVVQVVRSPAVQGASPGLYPGVKSEGRFFVSPLPLGGTYRIVAHRGHCYVTSEPIALDDRTPTRQIRLQLVEGLTFPVKVETPEGKRAVGVPVKLIYETNHSHSFGGQERRTDAEGKVAFEHVNAAAPGGYRLRIDTRRDFRPMDSQCTPSADCMTVKLEAGLSASGQVIHAETGRPIPEAEVSAYTTASGRYESIPAEARTDAKGRFRFSNMGPYVYRLRVSDATEDGEHHVNPRQPMEPWAVTVRVNLPAWSELKPAP